MTMPPLQETNKMDEIKTEEERLIEIKDEIIVLKDEIKHKSEAQTG